MDTVTEELKRATELTRAGKLVEATSVIQRALGILPAAAQASAAQTQPEARRRGRPRDADVTDVVFRELRAPAGRAAETPATARAPRPGTFEAHRFPTDAGTYTYRLFLPPQAGERALPVIVMLHGCTQDAADFAAGTAMNELAAEQGCIVVYPEQLARSNTMRCWNWFDPAHQQRGRGEPAMIAALATHVVQRHGGDARRVYVAGLSAGGAMAALAGQLYPDVFAAVGVHSGLPVGAASDVRTAHAAMRKATRQRSGGQAGSAAVPTIVLHGRADPTVHPGNGRHVVEDAVARMAAAGVRLAREEQQVPTDGRPVTRTVYRDAGAVPRLEHWEIAAGPHAWSGGSAAGSHTDPGGPDASAAMVAFFLLQELGPQDR